MWFLNKFQQHKWVDAQIRVLQSNFTSNFTNKLVFTKINQ